jgi:hypothetical protein
MAISRRSGRGTGPQAGTIRAPIDNLSDKMMLMTSPKSKEADESNEIRPGVAASRDRTIAQLKGDLHRLAFADQR